MDQQTEGYHVKTNNIHSQNIYKNVCKGFVDVEKTAWKTLKKTKW